MIQECDELIHLIVSRIYQRVRLAPVFVTSFESIKDKKETSETMGNNRLTVPVPKDSTSNLEVIERIIDKLDTPTKTATERRRTVLLANQSVDTFAMKIARRVETGRKQAAIESGSDSYAKVSEYDVFRGIFNNRKEFQDAIGDADYLDLSTKLLKATGETAQFRISDAHRLFERVAEEFCQDESVSAYISIDELTPAQASAGVGVKAPAPATA